MLYCLQSTIWFNHFTLGKRGFRMNIIKKMGWLFLVILFVSPFFVSEANAYNYVFSDGKTVTDILGKDISSCDVPTSAELEKIKTAVFLGFATGNLDTFVRDGEPGAPFFQTGDSSHPYSSFGDTISYLQGHSAAESFFTKDSTNYYSHGNERLSYFKVKDTFTYTHDGTTISLLQGDFVVAFEDWNITDSSDYNDMWFC